MAAMVLKFLSWLALTLAVFLGGKVLHRSLHLGAAGGGVDTKDCFFDKDCHELVDWQLVGDLKGKFFAALKEAKEKGSPEEVPAMLVRMRRGFLKAGMPEDRIDYILTKWVRFAYPEALERDHGRSSVVVSGFACKNGYGASLNQEYTYRGTTKDGRAYYQGKTRGDRYIYYDKYCAGDTREPRWLLGGKPDVAAEFGLNADDGEGCENEFSIISDSKYLPSGTRKVAWNWCGDHGLHDSETVSIAFKEDLLNDDSETVSIDDANEVDRKDCYFDKECHAKVDWEKVGKMKVGFFARVKALKETNAPKTEIKELMEKAHARFAEDTGMPEGRIDYMLLKWVKYVYADHEKKGDPKDCYFDKECHAKVDWEQIGHMKERFFTTVKREKGNSTNLVPMLLKQMHEGFLKAGMPEDRIDYILAKWARSVYPEDSDGDQKADPGEPMRERANRYCAKEHPSRERECHFCGGACLKLFCPNPNSKDYWECVGKTMKSPEKRNEVISCHKTCMSKKEDQKADCYCPEYPNREEEDPNPNREDPAPEPECCRSKQESDNAVTAHLETKLVEVISDKKEDQKADPGEPMRERANRYCAKEYPSREQECHSCGGECLKSFCPDPNSKDYWECVGKTMKSPEKRNEVISCHKTCMSKQEDQKADPGEPARERAHRYCAKEYPSREQECESCEGQCVKSFCPDPNSKDYWECVGKAIKIPENLKEVISCHKNCMSKQEAQTMVV